MSVMWVSVQCGSVIIRDSIESGAQKRQKIYCKRFSMNFETCAINGIVSRFRTILHLKALENCHSPMLYLYVHAINFNATVRADKNIFAAVDNTRFD